jgi:hypothetical protein
MYKGLAASPAVSDPCREGRVIAVRDWRFCETPYRALIWRHCGDVNCHFSFILGRKLGPVIRWQFQGRIGVIVLIAGGELVIQP